MSLGEDLILALQLAFEVLDLLVLGILDGLDLAAIFEGEVSVFEKLPLPVVEDGGIEASLVAQVNADVGDMLIWVWKILASETDE